MPSSIAGTVNAGWQREPAFSEVNHILSVVGRALSIILQICDLHPVNLTTEVEGVVNGGSEERPRKLALLVRLGSISEFRKIDPRCADNRNKERLARGNRKCKSHSPAQRKGQEPHVRIDRRQPTPRSGPMRGS